jgi:hypothetical protein
MKCLLASINHLLLVKFRPVPSSKILFCLSDSRLCLKKLFRNSPVILKIVPKAMNVHWKQSTYESKGKMRLSENF